MLGLFIISMLLKLYILILHVWNGMGWFTLEEDRVGIGLVGATKQARGIVYCLGPGKWPSETWKTYPHIFAASQTMLNALTSCCKR